MQHFMPDRDSNHAELSFKAFSGMLWLLLGTIVQYSIRMFSLFVLARLLTPEDFGLVSLALVILGTFSIFSQLGLGKAIIQKDVIRDEHVNSGFTYSILLGMIWAIAVVFASPVLAHYFKTARLAAVLRIMSPILIFHGVFSYLRSLLERELLFRKITFLQFTTDALVFGLLAPVLAWRGFGLWSLVTAYLLKAVLDSVILLSLCDHAFRICFQVQPCRDLLSYGTRFSLTRIANYLANHGDNIVISRYLGIHVLGVYDRAYRLMGVMTTFFTSTVDSILFSSISRLQNDLPQIRKVFRRILSLTAIFMLPLSGLAYFLAPEVVLFMLGKTWVESIVPFQILAIALFFRLAYKVNVNVARAMGAVVPLAWLHGLYAILIAGGCFLFYPYGIRGIAYVVVVVIVIHFFLTLRLTANIIRLQYRQIVRAVLPSLLLTCVISLNAWCTTSMMRNMALPPAAIIALASSLAGLFFLLSVMVVPAWTVGRDGVWWFQTIFGLIRSTMMPQTADAEIFRAKEENVRHISK